MQDRIVTVALTEPSLDQACQKLPEELQDKHRVYDHDRWRAEFLRLEIEHDPGAEDQNYRRMYLYQFKVSYKRH